MPNTLPGQLSALFCIVVCGYALLRGLTPERVVALGLMLSLGAMVAFQDRVHWLDPQHRILMNDLCLMLLLACIATSVQRRWLIVATAAQLISVAVHLELAFHPAVRARAFMTANNALSYVVLAALAWGTWQVDRRHHEQRGPEGRLGARVRQASP